MMGQNQLYVYYQLPPPPPPPPPPEKPPPPPLLNPDDELTGVAAALKLLKDDCIPESISLVEKVPIEE